MFQICITFFLLQILRVKEDILKNVSAVFVHIIKKYAQNNIWHQFGLNYWDTKKGSHTALKDMRVSRYDKYNFPFNNVLFIVKKV